MNFGSNRSYKHNDILLHCHGYNYQNSLRIFAVVFYYDSRKACGRSGHEKRHYAQGLLKYTHRFYALKFGIRTCNWWVSWWEWKPCFFYQVFIASAFIICYKVLVKSCRTVEFGKIRFTNCKEMWTQSANCVLPNASEESSHSSTNEKTCVHTTQPAKPTLVTIQWYQD